MPFLGSPGFRRFAPTSLNVRRWALQSIECICWPFRPTGCFRPLTSSKQAWPPPKSKNSRSLTRPAAFLFAVSEGFEPPVRSPAHLFSRQAPSTTRTTHQGGSLLLVWMTGLEPATSWSLTRCATNCATSRILDCKCTSFFINYQKIMAVFFYFFRSIKMTPLAPRLP